MKKMKNFIAILALFAATALTASTEQVRNWRRSVLGVQIIEKYLSPNDLKDHGASIITPIPAPYTYNVHGFTETGYGSAGLNISFLADMTDNEKALWSGHTLSMIQPGEFYKLKNNETGKEEPRKYYFPFRFKTPLPDYVRTNYNIATDEHWQQDISINQEEGLSIDLILDRFPNEYDKPLVLLYNPNAPHAPGSDEKEYTINFVIQPEPWPAGKIVYWYIYMPIMGLLTTAMMGVLTYSGLKGLHLV